MSLSRWVRSRLVALVTRFVPDHERPVIRGDLDEWYSVIKARDGGWTARRRLLRELSAIPFRRFEGPAFQSQASRLSVTTQVRRFGTGLLHDLRYLVRRYRRGPFAATGSIVILASALGGAVVVLSVFRALLWPVTGIPSPDDVLVLQRVFPSGAFAAMPVAQARVIHEAFDHPFVPLGARVASVRLSGTTRRRLANVVGNDFFRLMGVAPSIGRGFEGRQVGEREVVLSHDLWQREFGEQDVLGRTLVIDRVPVTVVGVAPANFRGPGGSRSPSLWLSVDDVIEHQAEFGGFVQLMTARLAPNIPTPDALQAVVSQLDQEAARRFSFAWGTLSEAVGSTGGERQFVVQALVILSLLVVFVLFVASANVASERLADGMGRRHEYGLRKAIGASRARLIRQSMSETLALVGVATGLGVVAGHVILSLLPAWLPTPYDGSRMSFPIRGADLAIAILLAAVVAGLAGVVPALRTSSLSGTRIAGSRRRLGLRGSEFLVVCQVAFASAVAIIATLLVGRMDRLHSANLGYLEADRWVFPVQFDQRYDDAARLAAVQQVTEQLSGVMDVTSTWMSAPPFAAFFPSTPVGYGSANDTALTVSVLGVGSEYSGTMGTALLAGRGFRSASAARREVVLSARVATQLWPDRIGVGELIYLRGDAEPYVVVGVVQDGTYGSSDVLPMVLTDIRDRVPRSVSLIVHARNVTSVTATVSSVLQGIDPDLAIATVYPVSEWFERAWVLERAVADLSKVLGLVVLGISGFGLFAFVSRTVTDRAREIGIQRALGATGRRITVAIWGRTVSVTGLGFLVGLTLAVTGSRLLMSFLGAETSGGTGHYLFVLGVIVGVASLAVAVPLRRASTIDPVSVIRGD